jgi:hypothetical protein
MCAEGVVLWTTRCCSASVEARALAQMLCEILTCRVLYLCYFEHIFFIDILSFQLELSMDICKLECH